MRKILLSFILLAVSLSSFAGGVITVSGDITSNTQWTKDNIYLLSGYVYVVDGVTLTIQEGTIIKGDKNTKGSLIIEQGAKIIAIGTVAEPIVFTSNQAAGSRNYGDWGGLVLLGKAPSNNYNGGTHPVMEGGPRSTYGGTDPADSSGVLQYVRIEFAGIALSPNNEINGLSLYSVGNKTVLDHIQVSFSGDDSFEWFGGTVNSKHLVAYKGWDDDFDTDNGFSGLNQFGVSLRDPYAADQSGSKGFESDNDGNASYNFPRTLCVFSNFTLVGPVINPASYSYDANYVSGVHIRRNSSLSMLNSVVMGWPCGILLDGPKTADNVLGQTNDSLIVIENNIIAGIQSGSNVTGSYAGEKEIIYLKPAGAGSLTPTNTMASDSSDFGIAVGPITWYNTSSFKNKKYTSATSGVRLTNPFTQTGAPSFVPTSTSPIVYNGSTNTPVVAPTFTDPKVTSSFFDQVGYIGAFAGTGNTSDDWTLGWTNWDPNNTAYDLPLGINDPFSATSSVGVYPNPTKDFTTVRFNLATATSLSVSVVDMNGTALSTFPMAEYPAGVNEVNFSASNLTPGIYVVKLTSEHAIKSVKLTVY